MGEKFYGDYDAVFANWCLCYLQSTDVLNLLTEIYFLLKPNGYFILKEVVLFDEEIAPRLCPSG